MEAFSGWPQHWVIEIGRSGEAASFSSGQPPVPCHAGEVGQEKPGVCEPLTNPLGLKNKSTFESGPESAGGEAFPAASAGWREPGNIDASLVGDAEGFHDLVHVPELGLFEGAYFTQRTETFSVGLRHFRKRNDAHMMWFCLLV